MALDDDEMKALFARLDEGDLLGLWASLMAELNARGIVRPDNNPLGDYCEFLVAAHYGVAPQGNSNAGFDVRTKRGERIQVKGRRLNAKGRKPPHFSGVRNLDDELPPFGNRIGLIINRDFSVREAWTIPLGRIQPLRDVSTAHEQLDSPNDEPSYASRPGDQTVQTPGTRRDEDSCLHAPSEARHLGARSGDRPSYYVLPCRGTSTAGIRVCDSGGNAGAMRRGRPQQRAKPAVKRRRFVVDSVAARESQRLKTQAVFIEGPPTTAVWLSVESATDCPNITTPKGGGVSFWRTPQGGVFANTHAAPV